MLAILTFVITLSLLVVIHELGHYFVARWCGVKIIVFSIGFGPKLISFKSKSNEWRLSSIPLGGYVQMLDEQETKLPVADKHLAFNQKKAYQKILIAAAGPLFNLLFALCAYIGIAMNGVPTLKPIIASINPTITRANDLKLATGLVIQSINNFPVNSWDEANTALQQVAKNNDKIILATLNGNMHAYITLSLKDLPAPLATKPSLESWGLYPVVYLPIIAYLEPGSAAQVAGLKVGDKLVAINKTKINNWFQAVNIIQNSPKQILNLTILRNQLPITLKVVPQTVDNDGQLIGKLGIIPTLDQNLLQQNSFIRQYGLIKAIKYACNASYNVVKLNLSGLYAIVRGRASIHDLGGPITIAKIGSTALAVGLKNFVDFLALISIGLAIMNLLPIPVLDGGQIVIYSIEWLLGHKLTYATQQLIFKLGFILIIGISLLAIYNDILRL